MGLGTRNILQHLGGGPCLLETLRKKGEQIFMKFSGLVGYETMNFLEDFEDVAFNSLNPASVFLFSGYVLDSNIIEKRMNRFS